MSPTSPEEDMSTSSDYDDEELQLDYEDACNEALELEQELRAQQLQAQQLRLRLQAVGIEKAAMCSALDTQTTNSPDIDTVDQEQKIQGICDMFQWIADYVDLSESTILTAACEVPVGKKLIRLQEVVQWPLLRAAGGNLKLTVPIEHQDEIAELLRITKTNSCLCPESLRCRLAETWELVSGELSLPMRESSEPAVLLAHRANSTGILVAAWPTAEDLEDLARVYAPADHVPKFGDRVEIPYQGEWYVGTLHSADVSVGSAVVNCDADGPHVYTVVRLSDVRHLSTSSLFAIAEVANKSIALSDTCPAVHEREEVNESQQMTCTRSSV